MATLDVSPMMTALRFAPEEFEIKQGWLHHIPSRHDFSFDTDGGVHIRAECNCAHLAIRTDQAPQLTNCYKEWQTTYWQPLLTNTVGTSGTLQVTDLLATNFMQRFYRAVYP